MSIINYFRPEFISDTFRGLLNNPHTSTHIRVEDDQGNFLYECNGSKSDINYYGYSRDCSLLEALVFPVRTDNIADLASDLMPLITRSDTIGQKALALIGDCLTLPIRLITLLPRIAFNALYKHPLARIDASHFPLKVGIFPYIPGWVRVPYLNFWIPGYVSSVPTAKAIADRYANEKVEALQKAIDTGSVNIVVTTTVEKDRFTLKKGEPVQIITTTRFRAYTKPSIEPLRFVREWTTYKPYSLWGTTTRENLKDIALHDHWYLGSRP